jgi:hypothetical protein
MRTKDACFLKFFDGKPNIKKEVKLKTPRELQVRFSFDNIFNTEIARGDKEAT